MRWLLRCGLKADLPAALQKSHACFILQHLSLDIAFMGLQQRGKPSQTFYIWTDAPRFSQRDEVYSLMDSANLICKKASPPLPPPHLHNCAHSWCSSAEAARHLLLPSRLICSLDALVLLLSRLVLCFLGWPPALGLAAIFHLCRSWCHF